MSGKSKTGRSPCPGIADLDDDLPQSLWTGKQAKPYYDEELERAFPLGRRGRAIETLDFLVTPYFGICYASVVAVKAIAGSVKSRCLVVMLPHSH